MYKNTVSVHIVTYNSADDIGECLEAVLNQDYPIKKVVVIDNASSDGSAEKVKDYLVQSQKKPTKILDLILLKNKKNIGFASAHNQAILATDTDYVLVLNPDLVLEKDYVSKLLKSMISDSQLGSATGLLLLKEDHTIVDSTGLRMDRARRAFDRGAGEQAAVWSEPGYVLGVSGAAAMYSRRMIEDISIDGEFFDEDFFAYKEDVDVAWRANLFGWLAFYEATAVGYHERGWKRFGRKEKSVSIRRNSYINRYKMIFKNEPVQTLFFTMLYSLPYEIAAHVFMLLKEPELFSTWSSFFSQRPQMWKKRRYIQNKLQNKNYDG